jgi:hypothetical protein
MFTTPETTMGAGRIPGCRSFEPITTGVDETLFLIQTSQQTWPHLRNAFLYFSGELVLFYTPLPFGRSRQPGDRREEGMLPCVLAEMRDQVQGFIKAS